MKLGNAIPGDATPKVFITGHITDRAGNATPTGQSVTAIDGVAPSLTINIPHNPVTGTADFQVTSDRLPYSNYEGAIIVKKVTDATTGELGSIMEHFISVSPMPMTAWWTYLFATDETDDGIYNVYVSVSDVAGNTATLGNATNSTANDALTFVVSNAPTPPQHQRRLQLPLPHLH